MIIDSFDNNKIEAIAEDGTLLEGHILWNFWGSTCIVMHTPFSIAARKGGWSCDAKELLLEAYNDYLRLRKMEKEAHALYPKYQEELAKCKDDQYDLPKVKVFDEVYKSIISQSIILDIDELFSDWFGLEFYVPGYYCGNRDYWNRNREWKRRMRYIEEDDLREKVRIDDPSKDSWILGTKEVWIYEDDRSSFSPHFHYFDKSSKPKFEVEIRMGDLSICKSSIRAGVPGFQLDTWKGLEEAKSALDMWLNSPNANVPSETNYKMLIAAWNQHNRNNQVEL